MRGAAGRPGRGAGGLSAPRPALPALLLVAGVRDERTQPFVAALAEELRRLGHRVGRAEARPGALVLELASGGRVTAAPPGGPGGPPEALARLARSLDPQLDLLLVEDLGGEGLDGLPRVELSAPGAGVPVPGGALLTAADDAGSAPDIAALIARRVIRRRTGRSLDAALGRRRRGLAARALSLVRALLGRGARRG